MPKYDLNALGHEEFERLCQSLVQQVIGHGVKVYGMGKDGAREATFRGKAPYPSGEEQWDGSWIFQVKFHDTSLLGPKQAQRQLVEDLDEELFKVTKKYRHRCDNYILLSNVPLTPAFQRGVKDRIDNEIVPKYSHEIMHIHIWGAEEICRFLDAYPDIRSSYAHLLVAGDVISRLLGLIEEKATKLDEIVKMYCQGCFVHEQSAVLDDAGDVEDKKIELERVFIDLEAKPQQIPSDPSALEKIPIWLQQAVQDGDRKSALSYVLDDSIPNLVLVGGPGEGKSTLCQYISQIHRARILGRIAEIEGGSQLEQCTIRVPFRIFLREYAQWIASNGDSDSLFSYLAVHVYRESGIKVKSTEISGIVKDNAILLIVDGLDEVPQEKLRQRVLDNIKAFVEQVHVLKGNLRIIATTRPHGYSQEFDPKHNLHLVLMKLSQEKAIDYAKMWIKAREPSPTEAKRISDTFGICLKDRVVSVLSQTPLQVTILLVVIRARGTPPKQREELFERYMDTIYQREQKRRPELLRTEQEMIYGLHKYLAYLLHKRAEKDETAATMDMSEFRKRVVEYVDFCNPLLRGRQKEEKVDQIITEAGTRLVLIESPQEGKVGFGLTTTREFFAAAHLVDTAKDTSERDLRFKAISKAPYWRNVALFFAGRVGRTRPGEAASMIDMCRQIDTEGVDRFLKRGAELVVEMIDDRVLRQPHNEIGAIQYGLQVIDRGFFHKPEDFISMLGNLPKQYQSQVVRPFIEAKLRNIDVENLDLYARIYRTLFGCTKLYRSVIEKASKSDLEPVKLWSLSKAIEDAITENWALELLEYLTRNSQDNRLKDIVSSETGANALALAFGRYLQCSLSHNALVALTLANVKALESLERYRHRSNLKEEEASIAFDIDPRLKPEKNFVFGGSVLRYFHIINKDQYFRRHGHSRIFPLIAYPDVKREIMENASLLKAFCRVFQEESDVASKFFVSMFRFLLNPEDFANYEKVCENSSLAKERLFQWLFISILGPIPNVESELHEFHRELCALFHLYDKNRDIEREEIELVRLIEMRSDRVKKHSALYRSYIFAGLPADFEASLDQNILNSTKAWLEKRGLSMRALALCHRFGILSSTLDIDTIKFCLKMMESALKGKDHLGSAVRVSGVCVSEYKWHRAKTKQEMTAANQFRRISESIIENRATLGLGEDSFDMLFRAMLTAGVLEKKHMVNFYEIFRNSQEFPKRVWLSRDANLPFLRTMLQDKRKENALLAAVAMIGTLKRARILHTPRAVPQATGDLKTGDRFWELAKDSKGHVWQPVLIEGLAYCSLAWVKKHEELLQAIRETKTKELLAAWVSVILQAGYKRNEDRDALVCMLAQILGSEGTFTRDIKTGALQRLYEVMSRSEPIGFEEKELNLPLSARD